MRFGVSQFTTWPWSFERDVREFAALGIGDIEVCEFKLDRDDYAPQFRLLAGAGLAVTSVQTTVHSIFPDSLAPAPAAPERRVAHILEALERIAPLVPEQTPFVVITGAAPGGDCERVYATLLEVLPHLAERAAAHGMRLAFEPLNPILFHTDTALWGLDDALALVERIGHPSLGLCLDTWNVFQTPRLAATIAAARERIFLVQLSDWRRPRANADRRSLGEGSIPNAAIVRAAGAAGYRGPFVLEIFSDESLPDSLWRGDIAATLRRNRGVFTAMTDSYRPDPAEENAADLDERALEQLRNGEPDELDGPAADLDRTLDDESDPNAPRG